MKNFYLLLGFLITLSTSSWSQEYKKMISEGTHTVQEIQQSAEAHFAIVGTERGKGYKPYKRWEYQALLNMDENGMLKTPEYYFNELENYNNFVNQNSVEYRTTVGTWEQLGPSYWNQTSGWNPGVGRVTSIAVEPTNINHIIVGANTGGVWRTTDGGATWTVLTDNLSTLTVYALAIDPSNPSTYFWGSSSGTIFKSTDSGATWNILADTGVGNVNKILIDPTNTNKMYCSVDFGGIYKSLDAGVTWTLIDGRATSGYDIEFKPGNTNVVYASGNAFFKSTDGGATFTTPNGLDLWQQEYISGNNDWTTGGTNQNNTVGPRTGNAMAICYVGNFTSPITNLVTPVLDLSGTTNPVLNFSYTNVNWEGDIDTMRVLYKTSAAGSWTELASYTSESPFWTDITLNLPNASSAYYIAFEGTANFGRGFTLDDVLVQDGVNVIFADGFEAANNAFESGPKMIGVSNDDPNVVYVLESSGGVFGGFHRSDDSGETFNKLDHTNKNYFGYSSTASDDRGQAPRDMDVVVNPNDADDVHIAGILSWRSIDGGVNFNVSSQWVPQTAAAENIGYCHADIDIMEYVGNSTQGYKLYVGSDGGIFVADNPLVVNSSYYRDLTPGLGIRQFYKIGVSQTNPVVVTGGSQDNGSSVLGSDGVWRDWLGADGMEGFVDKTNSNILYGTSQFGTLYKSFNQGSNSTFIPSPLNKSGNWITPFEQDPSLQDVIYTGYDEVYKSTDAGNSWSSISQNFGGNLNHLKIAPSNNLIMLAARGGDLYKTTTGGIAGNWTQLSGFNGNINSIAIHPSDPNKIAIATTSSQKVYISTNGGNSWTPYRLSLPDFSARALVWENNGKDGLYLGMNYGVFYIDNTFADWQPFSNNLPNVIISELEINTADNKLYAGTYGRGLWRSDLFDPLLSVEEFELNSIKMFPNPATNQVSLVWSKPDQVSIKIFNSLGKLMYFTNGQSLVESIKIDVSNYASGLYFVTINNLNGIVTKKLMVE
ncbi:T9SS type A sorting domain-containing protein [uncultured Psychroserpens sp.]|uniref:T9SS type A sorting domain-containing protein n=1 Tax=uncultured Psychroserpens sp. TaxID=255436 RepID=UPI00260C4DE0|nr:T9SS type A sorting domain-containing protein [uncultured Psychroserpens sp.]